MDGQLVLLEISQQDGAWPRSQLQSMFEAEEEEAQAGTAVSCYDSFGKTSNLGGGMYNMFWVCFCFCFVLQCLLSDRYG